MKDEGYPGVGRVLVVIPTYNEAENLPVIVDRLRRAVLDRQFRLGDERTLATRLGLWPEAVLAGLAVAALAGAAVVRLRARRATRREAA